MSAPVGHRARTAKEWLEANGWKLCDDGSWRTSDGSGLTMLQAGLVASVARIRMAGTVHPQRQEQ